MTLSLARASIFVQYVFLPFIPTVSSQCPYAVGLAARLAAAQHARRGSSLGALVQPVKLFTHAAMNNANDDAQAPRLIQTDASMRPLVDPEPDREQLANDSAEGGAEGDAIEEEEEAENNFGGDDGEAHDEDFSSEVAGAGKPVKQIGQPRARQPLDHSKC